MDSALVDRKLSPALLAGIKIPAKGTCHGHGGSGTAVEQSIDQTT